jgi:hypothetical protein
MRQQASAIRGQSRIRESDEPAEPRAQHAPTMPQHACRVFNARAQDGEPGRASSSGCRPASWRCSPQAAPFSMTPPQSRLPGRRPACSHCEPFARFANHLPAMSSGRTGYADWQAQRGRSGLHLEFHLSRSRRGQSAHPGRETPATPRRSVATQPLVACSRLPAKYRFHCRRNKLPLTAVADSSQLSGPRHTRPAIYTGRDSLPGRFDRSRWLR